jgi:hypothetical protein
MDIQEAQYRYEPLPTGKWTRLLRLFPGKPDDPIIVDLFPIDLESRPSYEAVSYAWGDPGDRRKITCLGHPTHITVSLFQALHRFRQSTEVRILWADAICIDQSNVMERGHQVSIMSSVYEGAERVLIWIGEDTMGAAKQAFQFITVVNQYLESEALKYQHIKNPRALISNIPLEPGKHPLVNYSRELSNVRKVVQRPYFSRVWALQEVGLASSALVHYGKYTIGIEHIVQLCLVFSYRMDLRLNEASHLANALLVIWSTFDIEETWLKSLYLVHRLAGEMRKQARVDFSSVLACGRAFQASDPRDHIYAFLGHPLAKAIRPDSNLVEVDYNITPEGLNKLSFVQLCHYSRSLDALSEVECSYSNVAHGQGISWVPRWNEARVYRAKFHLFAGVNASRTEEMPGKFVAECVGDQLHTRGLVIEEVRLHSWEMERDDGGKIESVTEGDGEDINFLEMCWVVAEKAKKQREPYGTFRGKELLRTLCAGMHHFSGGDSIQADFLDYCEEACSRECYTSISESWQHDVDDRQRGVPHRFEGIAARNCHERRFFTTLGGLFGLGSKFLEPGDLCCVIFGANVPFIIRPTNVKSPYNVLM